MPELTDSEMRQFIIKEIMGWRPISTDKWKDDETGLYIDTPGGFNPLTDMNHAMQVVARLREKGIRFSLTQSRRTATRDNVYRCSFSKVRYRYYQAIDPDPARCISLAAVKAWEAVEGK